YLHRGHYQLLADGEVIQAHNVQWTGNIARGERDLFSIVVENVPPGAYEIAVTLKLPNGMPDARMSNNFLSGKAIRIAEIRPFSIEKLDQLGASPCVGSDTYLRVNYDGDAAIRWYFEEESDEPVAEGPHYFVNGLLSDFTIYAEALVTSHIGIPMVDPANSSVGNDNGGSLVFDALAPFLLKSVKVYVETPGLRLLTLRNADGAEVQSQMLNLSETGEQRVELNFEIPEGQDWSIEINAGLPLQHSTQTNYPYKIANVVSIKQSGDFINPLVNYYYFYDWEIVHNHVCGRQAFDISYQMTEMAPEAQFEASAEIVSVDNGALSFTNFSSNAQQLVWDFGDGNSSTAENPVHIYSEEGIYTVVLTALNSEGCSDVAILPIEVASVLAIEELFDEQNIKVYPNPTWLGVEVAFQFNNPQEVRMELVDVLGRSIRAFETRRYRRDEVAIPLSQYDSGVYFLVCQINDQKIVKRIVKLD
ncbi:MAG: PKD domain-containing protein, partial [Bacteroidota bacterium]